MRRCVQKTESGGKTAAGVGNARADVGPAAAVKDKAVAVRSAPGDERSRWSPEHRFGELAVTAGAADRAVTGLRGAVSRVTGIDVGAVPISTGDTGGKRALARDGRVTLGSGATCHDVAHELAHAAQQRGVYGPWLGGGALEDRADRVADAVLAGATQGVAPGRAPAATILGAGDPYGREAVTLPAPPTGMSVKDLKDQLQLKIDVGDITGYAVAGVKPGDPEEPFLYNALIRLANSKRWGSEMDLVTDIGAGKGMVTVRFDAAGKAEARLVGKSAPAVPAAFAKVQDAKDALVAKYKLAKVAGEKGRDWKIDELNKVLAAWGRLSTTEAAALDGFSLIRTDKLVQNGENLQGQTTHSDDVAQGSPTVTHLREIRFADSAFADDANSFVGDAGDAAPASFVVLIHEVGHAVEAKPFDDLNRVAADDTGKANQAGNDAHAAQVAANRAINAALATKMPKADASAGQPLFDAVSAAQKSLKDLEQNPDSTHETAAKKAVADRDAVKATIPAGNKAAAALASAITAQDTYLAALGKLVTLLATASASRTKADALKTGANTTRLDNFVQFVNKEKIPPPTSYASKHWPAEPAEFYDEAFSLWKNDPTFFAKYSPKLKAWFDAGNHLK